MESKDSITTPSPQDLQTWLSNLRLHHPHLQFSQIEKAVHFFEQCTPFIARHLSDPAVHLGIEMAEQLLTITSDTEPFIAALVYPLFQAIPTAAAPLLEVTTRLQNDLGPTIAKLLRGVNQMAAIQQSPQGKNHEHFSPDNLRKMLLAMVDDIRVVLIKLVERLILLKHLKNKSPAEQITVSQETLSIYAPLANRLGIGQLKWQLEDYAFRYLYPHDYKQLAGKLNMRRHDREVYIERMVEQLQTQLKNAHIINATVSGRAKHLYGIYKKLQRKKIELAEIYDVLALRVLVPTISDCYTTLSLVHALWRHLSSEFDDYIANPKMNGYQSIHTAIIGPEGVQVEIQIRTYEMHELNERGIAAHWVYKENDPRLSNQYEQKINWLRHLIHWQHDLSLEQAPVAPEIQKIFSDQVYVFTPEGDVVDLPQGATALDFAYYIHSDVGHRCLGAKVNQKFATLKTRLQTGDRVQIITSKVRGPSRDWLNPQLGFLHTNRARSKVRAWFRQLEQASSAVKTENHAHEAIASITTAAPSPPLKPLPITAGNATASTTSPKFQIILEGVGQSLTQLARCCDPAPGCDIVGYITQSRGVTIHRKSCSNLIRAEKTRPERLLVVYWK